MNNPNLEELYKIIADVIENKNPTISQEVLCHIEKYSKFKEWIGKFKIAKYNEHIIDNLAKEFRYCLDDGVEYAYVLTMTKVGWPNEIYSYGTIRTIKQMKSFAKAAKREGEIISFFDIEQGKEIEL